MAALLTALCAMTLLVAQPATAAPTIADAQTAAKSVREFRPEVSWTLDEYRSTYAKRLTATERSEVDGMVMQAERSLRMLQARTNRTLALAKQGTSQSKVLAAARAADAAYEQAHQSAVDALARMQPMLLPKVSWSEALQAKLDADRMLAEYEAVGARIEVVTTS